MTEVQPFKKIKLSDCIKTIRKYGIRFKSKKILDEFNDLLAYYCNECSKDKGPFYSKRDLTTHVRKEHEKQFCNICLDNLKLFPQEFKMYSIKELVRHRRKGDIDEKSHRGHPECRFCEDRFFDNDALLVHLRKNHFWCHFCEHDGKQDYFNLYKDLRRHFIAEHYLCGEGNCVNEKFTSVFRDKIDFQAHKLAYHGKSLNKIQAKEARRVDLDYSFTRRQQKNNVVSGNDYEEVQREENRSRHHNRYKNSRDRYGTVNYYDYDDVEKERKAFEEVQREENRSQHHNRYKNSRDRYGTVNYYDYDDVEKERKVFEEVQREENRSGHHNRYKNSRDRYGTVNYYDYDDVEKERKVFEEVQREENRSGHHNRYKNSRDRYGTVNYYDYDDVEKERKVFEEVQREENRSGHHNRYKNSRDRYGTVNYYDYDDVEKERKVFEEVQREENRSRHHNRYKNSRDRYGTVNYYDYDDVEKERKVFEEVQREENRSRHHNRYKNSRDRYGTVSYYDYDDVEKERKVFQAKKNNTEKRDSPLEGTVNMATARSPSSEEEINDDDDVIGLPEHVNRGDRVKHEKTQVEAVNAKIKEETVKTTQPKNIENVPNKGVDHTDFATLPESKVITDKGIDHTDFPTLPSSKANTVQINNKSAHEYATDSFPTLAASNPSKKPVSVKEDPKNLLGTVLKGIPIKQAKKGKAKSWSKQSGRDINNVDDFPALEVANKQVKEQEKLSKSPKLGQKESDKEQMVAKQNYNKQLNRNPKITSPRVRKKEDNTMSQKPPPGFSKTDQQTSAGTKKSPPGLGQNDRPNEPPLGLEKSEADTADEKMGRNIRLLTMLQAILDDFTFGIFKNLSGEFRKDIKSAQEYYSGISELLGENLKVVFSELVALLPDPKKQEELLMIHNNEKIRLKENKEPNTQADYSRKAIWTGGDLVSNKMNVKKEITESFCAQSAAVVPKELIQEHMQSHAGEAFPALPTAVTKKKTYNFVPERANPQIPIKSAWKVK